VAIASVALPIGSVGGHWSPARCEACGSVASGPRDEVGWSAGGRASQRSWGVCSQRTPRDLEAKKVDGMFRLGGYPQRTPSGYIAKKVERLSELGVYSERTQRHHMAKEWASQRSWGCAHSEPLDTIRRTRWRTCRDRGAQNGREDIIWQKSGHPAKLGGVLTANPQTPYAEESRGTVEAGGVLTTKP
jgi:hypothetical protein